MSTQDQIDVALQRTAIAAFIYYPQIHVDQPDYRLDEDVAWCVEPLGDLEGAALGSVRDAVGRAIVDPSEFREELFAALSDLADPDATAE
ncbi:hypothetical protein [Agromyces mariniharenae]|uniref:Uncharacterized protein n=1 Tax=Agromyces mariniharenae TaxID=2604423 RepID=A0A5S4UZ93_9MICO|nr:hypothetical protein [Agromyces mariniharenae]TYL50431.1 hypothetical protein FYC51_14585 [Agromyces mariniharenae]